MRAESPCIAVSVGAGAQRAAMVHWAMQWEGRGLRANPVVHAGCLHLPAGAEARCQCCEQAQHHAQF